VSSGVQTPVRAEI